MVSSEILNDYNVDLGRESSEECATEAALKRMCLNSGSGLGEESHHPSGGLNLSLEAEESG